MRVFCPGRLDGILYHLAVEIRIETWKESWGLSLRYKSRFGGGQKTTWITKSNNGHVWSLVCDTLTRCSLTGDRKLFGLFAGQSWSIQTCAIKDGSTWHWNSAAVTECSNREFYTPFVGVYSARLLMSPSADTCGKFRGKAWNRSNTRILFLLITNLE